MEISDKLFENYLPEEFGDAWYSVYYFYDLFHILWNLEGLST